MFVVAIALVAAALSASSPSHAALSDEYTPGPCITNAVQTSPFVDVPHGRYFTNAVGWAYLNGITKGTDESHFSPADRVRRAQFATFLHRMMCEPAATGTAPFDDLGGGAYYEEAVDWLWSEDLTNGKRPGEFAPEEFVTRGQFAAFVHRLVGEPTGAPVSDFVDVDRSRYYAPAIDWLFWRGITNGTSGSEFSPEREISRGEAVTMLYRLNIASVGLIDPADIGLGFVGVLSGLTQPLGAASHPDGSVFVIEKGGRVVKVPASGGMPDWAAGVTEVLDLGSTVSSGGEQGLLGVAIAPDGSQLYLSYTDTAGDSVVVEYDLTGSTISGGPRTVITVDQPAGNHNGGHITFGPDGHLYASFGDGGGGCDSAGANGQNPETLLGSIVRIDPVGGTPYAIPVDNPFVGGAGADENWLIGVRNPWRFSFDSASGDLWVGDVGQVTFEEVTRLRATAGVDAGRGANLGWPAYEGTARTCGAPDITGHTGPTHQYPNPDRGRSVTGGVVYRGSGIIGLEGTYLFTDFYDSDLRGYNDEFGTGLINYGTTVPGGGAAAFFIAADGEVYVISMFGGSIHRITAAG